MFSVVIVVTLSLFYYFKLGLYMTNNLPFLHRSPLMEPEPDQMEGAVVSLARSLWIGIMHTPFQVLL